LSKECVITHRYNSPALKMNGAKADYLYSEEGTNNNNIYVYYVVF